MTQVESFAVAPEDQEKFFKHVRWGDRYNYPRIVAKRRPFSRGEKALHAEVSGLGDISFLWAGLTDIERQAWSDAGYWSGQTGYALFVQDTSYRISNSIAGLATPNEYHQYKVCRVTIPYGTVYARMFQHHNGTYNIARKITGTQNYEAVSITEALSGVFNLALNFKSSLTALGGAPYCTVWCWFRHTDPVEGFLDESIAINIPLSSDWAYASDEIDLSAFTIIEWGCGIEFHNVYGDLYFDVPEMNYGGQNWTIDQNCDLIGATLPNLGVPIRPAWEWDDVYDEITFESVYPTD